MKRWGVIIAVALTLLLGNTREVGAQYIVSETSNPNFSDSVICPDGCTQQTVVYHEPDGGTSTGTVYSDTTGAPLAVPGGYTPENMFVFSLLEFTQPKPSTDGFGDIGGGVTPITTGTLGTRYAGFYMAPNGKYYPITITDKNAGRKAKVYPSDIYDCPTDETAYFGTDADMF